MLKHKFTSLGEEEVLKHKFTSLGWGGSAKEQNVFEQKFQNTLLPFQGDFIKQ